MAGIYLHIPFCRKVCSYCDFYKSTMLSVIPGYIDALKSELHYRKEYLANEPVDTIYFGGGTPSLLTVSQVQEITDHIFSQYKVSENAEITLEANPDDLNSGYLKELSQSPINRLSIGIQSFDDRFLVVLNRRHNGYRALKCLEDARKEGFDNISIDLIYGLPEMSVADWKDTLALVPDVEHISAYHLTIEPGTAFYRKASAGLLSIPPEDVSEQQYYALRDFTGERDLIHYEISNMAKEGNYSKHNTAYWQRKKYLGVGPSAHSYDGNSRQWNVRDVRKYIENVNNGSAYFEREELSTADQFNEYLMVGLRTIWGIDGRFLVNEFGSEYLQAFQYKVSRYIDLGHIVRDGDIYRMTFAGWLISDHILPDLFIENKKSPD